MDMIENTLVYFVFLVIAAIIAEFILIRILKKTFLL